MITKTLTSPQSKNSGKRKAQASTARAVETLDTAALEAACQAKLVPVVERLRASWMAYGEDEEMRGMTAGRIWAEESAEAVELQRLASVNDTWWALVCTMDSPSSAAEEFFFAIRPDLDRNREAAADFWAAITGKRTLPELIFVRSFAERAMEVWDQVEDQL